MTVSLLTAANWPIVGQLCWLLGKVMNFIYTMLDNTLSTDTGLVGLSIIIYTIVVYTCMLPMTINQQKTTKMQAVITPEVQAIQKKYKNRKDQASLMKQQEEVQQVYDKYGTSMMGGCLPLLIQMPFLFALYPVIYNIESYVSHITDEANKFLTIPNMTISPSGMIGAVREGQDLGFSGGVIIATAIILPILSGATQYASIKLSQNITGSHKQADNDNPMAGTMKTMNYTMPLLSVFMVFTLPTGIGVYWIVSAIVRSVQQIAINKKLSKMSIEDLIEKNKEKAEKKRQKRGERNERINAMAQTNTKSIKTSANRTTLNEKEREEKIKKAQENIKEGSLASKANMVKKFNENK